LIAKWEDHARKRGANMINSEPRLVVGGKESNINVITRGGINTGVDAAIPQPHQIQKIVPIPRYDLESQKEFFKNVVELFRQMSDSTTQERVNLEFRLHGGVAENLGSSMVPVDGSHKPVNLWLHIFYDILENEQLTQKL
jgi:hypothetical protein